MRKLADAVDRLAQEKRFSGVVRADRGPETLLARAYGFADRGHQIPNSTDTQFALASGTKGLTALAVVSLIEDGTLDLATTARSLLGDDLPLIDDRVTVEHLLAHRSGIGDYYDEDADLGLTDYGLPVPVHELAAVEDYLGVLDGYPAKFAPGERFNYNNGAFVVLALLAERASGVGFYDLVRQRVCEPAGLYDTWFPRSDELPGRAALGYLEVDGAVRTNLFHLPVRGGGDGGAYSTAANVHALWDAFFAGRIVPKKWVAEMVRPHSETPHDSMRYGLGFWLRPAGGAVLLEGCDPGISFRSVHDPETRVTHTVISNTADGAWPVTRLLTELLAT
ncbi:serine hydrolase domain-containing protein [Amycolatopsis anabasis]|uniref:serine hydrolase domain-containing protein n=1 Tax=Amycolatopsis anabasis TaxID=1840409 RepID=UPI00131BCDCE|nr:serine hydrolase domain-containing protein [Amycolatopsis anabasis]